MVGSFAMISEGSRKPDWLGRGIGLAVFAGGIALLVLVFVWANQEFGAPLPKYDPRDPWAWGIRLAVQIARLAVSWLVASSIAGRGAQMYAAANRALSAD